MVTSQTPGERRCCGLCLPHLYARVLGPLLWPLTAEEEPAATGSSWAVAQDTERCPASSTDDQCDFRQWFSVGGLCPPGNVWLCLETCLVVTAARMSVASSSKRPGMPLNIPGCTGQPQQEDYSVPDVCRAEVKTLCF